ncbi:Organic hydroperoxide resistance transcriptional regulator [Alloactinosynnema sp. L-07]|uniref:MarR family winged helix-turn-helix transcriptional regulator n=1 Tax=Alloactinosynnema sp. L-07 TaxID=1653480 RepID=UPI00065EFC59|nr:MarR family transcriptional regulator [Alloactinosynnema sp. L-07]CRK58297.1 Organic hydroperoxide resistance transcriptional regulator [Alloactinosynnema sp. L-07]
MADPLALEQQLCFALYTASRALTGRYRPLLDDLGLTYPQYLVMLALLDRGPLTVKDLGQALQLDSGTLSPLLKRMESAGILRRTRGTADERSVLVELTDAGEALRRPIRELPRTVFRDLDTPLEDLIDLHSRLTKFLTKIS